VALSRILLLVLRELKEPRDPRLLQAVPEIGVNGDNAVPKGIALVVWETLGVVFLEPGRHVETPAELFCAPPIGLHGFATICMDGLGLALWYSGYLGYRT
jgi:hypothetical protein